jgi:hypothetical protein
MHRLGLEIQPADLDSWLGAQRRTHVLFLDNAREISYDLGRSRILHFFGKGIALLGSVYQPGDRHLADIDLYAHGPQRRAALDALDRLGYRVLPEAQQSGPSEHRSAIMLERHPSSDEERVRVHLRWTLDPVERLVPRRERPIPDRMWDAVWTQGHLRVPSHEHHAAILAHQLVRTDLLHVRTLLDLAYLFNAFTEGEGLEYLTTCRELRIGRFAIILAELMAKEFGIVRPYALADGPGRWTHFTRDLTLERYLTIAAETDPNDHNTMTIGRIRRRLELLDTGGAKTLYDALPRRRSPAMPSKTKSL